MKYRADIDGLRAVAVFLVIFYHFRLFGFQAGFLGVDVFFVISGYLISALILQNLRDGSFGFADFYARRFRRIVPALVVVLLATWAAGYLLLYPVDMGNLGWQILYGALGAGNFYPYLHSGYFDTAAEMLPTLHLWSLGVEEQFYLLWPLLYWLCWKLFRGNGWALLLLTALVFAASLVAQVIVAAGDDQFAFFMLPTRAWQLAAGALVLGLPRPNARVWAEGAAGLGLGLILGSAVYFENDGASVVSALLTCLGAMLVLWSGTAYSPLVGRLLALPPMVFLGLISYSLYLWHWPVLVFFREWNFDAFPSQAEAAMLVGATVVLAVLSWALVERPMRQRRWGNWPSIGTAVLTAAALAAAGYLTAQSGGLPGRLSGQEARYASYLGYDSPKPEGDLCWQRLERDDVAKESCLISKQGKPVVLVVGDSHATHLAHGLVDSFPDLHFVFITRSGCRPVLEPVANNASRVDCPDYFKRAFNEILPKYKFSAVLLAARWESGQADQLAATVASLKTNVGQVVVIGQIMAYPLAVPELLTQHALQRRDIDVPIYGKLETLRKLNAQIQTDVTASGGAYFDILEELCSSDSCRMTTAGDVPIQYDFAHITREGMIEIIAALKAKGLLKGLSGA